MKVSRVLGMQRYVLLAVLAVSVAAVSIGCRDQGGTTTRGRDAGVVNTTCATTQDCGGSGVCVAGLCQQVTSCNQDSECEAEGKVCHQDRFFCVDCDGRDGQCADGFRCQFDFTCVEVQTSTMTGRNCASACQDRSMCQDSQVCDMTMGLCCDPPSRCRSPADCPASRPECNGATGQCFGGDGCFDDRECENKPGCGGGLCFCDITGQPPGVCRMRGAECTNDMECFDNGNYVQKYCTLGMPPARCLDAPACTNALVCSALGLVCDLDPQSPYNGYCRNGDACPMGNECGAMQVCVGGVCVGENCVNNPNLCQPGEMCDAVSLMCIPSQGGACTVDTDCQQGFYCNTTVSPSRCEVGCRDNNDCPGGICNAMHQCEQASGGLCGPCNTDADCPAGTTCFENPITAQKKCYEQCNQFTGQMCMIDASATCVFTRCSCGL